MDHAEQMNHETSIFMIGSHKSTSEQTNVPGSSEESHVITNKAYCAFCKHYMTHLHPFYHDEKMEACLSNPDIIGTHYKPQIRFTNPSVKNCHNDCREYRERFSSKTNRFWNAIVSKIKGS